MACVTVGLAVRRGRAVVPKFIAAASSFSVTVAFTVFVSLHILHILQVGASACTDVQVARIDACSKLGGDTGWGAVTVTPHRAA